MCGQFIISSSDRSVFQGDSWESTDGLRGRAVACAFEDQVQPKNPLAPSAGSSHTPTRMVISQFPIYLHIYYISDSVML